ncbi:Poly(3-hydroxyalkanoate) synthetase-like protein [Ancylobacter novellus DSM 506]|uniref:Poly(3-hydroxyalkanoate) synthetase-like protein n=1 Tax=Ancylobacter novellus (strain ATCC 8093 / DSM 506 / JCM 20403 / CCM 1077 / IAM 12100 / NBRC 12443 / NCIMB 10456) TaxID=639283 RepID=D7AAZ2_ANCN5|nr:alpha/beta hydrolase [Ancylobacter novellus]ADH91009.1 Poly(3-hydroxyalkanoate) synthetase-like protein [Ancylobacter novellus DSM 506]
MRSRSFLHDSPEIGAFDVVSALRSAQLGAMDNLRRLQAGALDRFGFGPRECVFDVIASGPNWRLRHYPGEAASAALLMVPAPIKRPYIWDLTPGVSVVRLCLERGLGVHLIEWLPPQGDGSDGIADYVDAIGAAGKVVAAEQPGAARFVLGHSLGGTLAAIACALQPEIARGLVLLGAPLSFEPGSSPFRDQVAAQKRPTPEQGTVAGSQLSQSCAMLSPGTFIWNRWMDGALSLADPAAFDIHMHIERWALDEVPLAGRLIHQMVDWLYRENRFQKGTLAIGGRTLGPGDLRLPVLAAVSEADEIGPRASVEPFFARMTGTDTQILAHPAEIGVGLQHLAILAGRRAHAEVWPRIATWIGSHAASDAATSDAITGAARTTAHARPARAPRASPASPRRTGTARSPAPRSSRSRPAPES